MCLFLKKKILYVTESFGGGVFSYLVDLSNKLSDSYDICIAYSLRDQTPLNFRDYFNSRIKLIEVKNFTRNINPFKDIRAMNELLNIAKDFKPDIIHLHSSKAGVLGRVLFNFSHVSLYYTPHGYSFLMKDASKIERSLYWCIEKLMGFSKSTTISCSKGEFKESLKLTKRNMIVNNGINIDELSKVESNVTGNINSNRITIFTIGRISEQKNPKLFNKIAENVPNINFLWIGDGDLKSELTSKNIKVTGWLERKEVLKLARGSNLFLLTSLWEGLPISLLEAMYLEKPCFVSNVIGNNDVIENGRNGFICDGSAEFVRKIKYLLSNHVIEKKILKNAKMDVLNKYNMEVMSEKYNEIYSNK